jgi:hypothetical protein
VGRMTATEMIKMRGSATAILMVVYSSSAP